MLQSVHRQGYHAPAVRRVYIPKPGKTEKRPLGVPTIADRALQRSAAEVMSAIYEQDFLPCSFRRQTEVECAPCPGDPQRNHRGGQDKLGAGGGWVKNFFGSLSPTNGCSGLSSIGSATRA